LKEQLLLLLELQGIDSRVQELLAQIEALPARLAPAKRDLTRLEAMLQSERDRLAENEAWRKEQEALIEHEDDAIRKAKVKLQNAKNSKDYTAANRELDNKRKSKSEREEEVLKVMDVLEKSRAELQAHEKDVNALRQHLEAEDERVKALVIELEAEAKERSAGRGDLVARVEPRLLAIYERIMKKRGGQAVAAVVNAVCQGCHMAIPPQLNNELAQLSSVASCPRCGRMLYRKELLDAPSAEESPEESPEESAQESAQEEA
jgi:uncharacterized protein